MSRSAWRNCSSADAEIPPTGFSVVMTKSLLSPERRREEHGRQIRVGLQSKWCFGMKDWVEAVDERNHLIWNRR